MVKKICKTCRKTKSVAEFYKNKALDDGFNYRCRLCVSIARKKLRAKWARQRALPGYEPKKEKRCWLCKEVKSSSDFYKNPSNKDGMGGTCKACSAVHHKRSRKNPVITERNRARDRKRSQKPEVKIRHRNARLKRKYGINVDQYNLMVKEQDGVCAICGESETRADHRSSKKRKLAIDHCHKTDIVRGLLCGRCNTGIGAFEDNIDIMASAISYLQQRRV